MSPQGAAERKAAERARKREAGRQRFDEWLTPKELKAVQTLLRKMRSAVNQTSGTK